MESTSLRTPDDALSYIAPIGEFVPYTCNVTASHPTIRTRVRSLQRRWLLFCLSEIGQTLVLFSCCLRVVSLHLTSHHPTCQNAKAGTEYGQPSRSLHLTLGHGLKHPSSALRSSHTAGLTPKYACLHRLLPHALGLLCSGAGECQSKSVLLSSESFPIAVATWLLRRFATCPPKATLASAVPWCDTSQDVCSQVDSWETSSSCRTQVHLHWTSWSQPSVVEPVVALLFDNVFCKHLGSFFPHINSR